MNQRQNIFIMRRLIITALLLITAVACGKQDIPATSINDTRILSHPRLLYTPADAALTDNIERNNPLARTLEASILRRADYYLTAEDLKQDPVSLEMSRECVLRTFTLAMAYRRTGDKKYSEKLDAVLRHICSFYNWDPGSFLAVAEMTTAIAVGYDWCYDALPEDTKSIVRGAIYNHALAPAIKEYESGGENSFVKRENNWNVVCNTGIVLGALAVADHYPREAEGIVGNAVKYVPNCLKFYDPDGVCYEGPTYYEYTNTYLSMLLKALNDNFKTDYGLSDLPGVSKTASYYVHTVSPSGRIFNFADSQQDEKASYSPLFFYFSRKFADAEVAHWYRGHLSEALANWQQPSFQFPLALAWFDDTSYSPAGEKPRMETFHNVNDILVLRGNGSNPKAIHLMAKGADPDMSHQQADGGSFVVESEGTRWIVDLGCDDYGVPGYWDYAPEGARWRYFRENALSHNTITIGGRNQYSAGTAHLSEEHPDAQQPGATFDMSSLYPSVTGLWRTFTLSSDTSIQIRDRITMSSAGLPVTWTGMTMATVSVDGNTATLKQNGKTFRITVAVPEGATFTAAQPQPSTPYEKPLDGVTMLRCTILGTAPETILEVILAAE